MFQARWAYDGSAQGGKKIAFGSTWVVPALVVKLPFCPSPVALPVLSGPKPPPAGKRGRPAAKGARIGTCAGAAQAHVTATRHKSPAAR